MRENLHFHGNNLMLSPALKKSKGSNSNVHRRALSHDVSLTNNLFLKSPHKRSTFIPKNEIDISPVINEKNFPKKT